MRRALYFAAVAVAFDFTATCLRADDAEDFFESLVRPLLIDHCLDCHGDDAPEAELRLTSRESVLRGGLSGPAAIAGNPDGSILLQAVMRDGRLKMPPSESLATAQISDLRTWIENGLAWPQTDPVATSPAEMEVTAADREHWAFRAIQPSVPPEVADSGWPQNAIDHFVLSQLETAGLRPAPPADRRTLLRRIHNDLTGLPPTWEELQAFEQDSSLTAFASLVDRLLASPRYGERWGRHWLDVARYADTKDGVLMFGDDRLRPFAYTYRDYVVRSFNEDTPFDRFVEEQLAADLLDPPVESWKLPALGFLTLGKLFDGNTHDVVDDQIDTVSRGLLGLTLSCARCHDHKFDPIPAADYYSLYGVFANCEVPPELPLIAPVSDTPGGAAFEEQILPKREALRALVEEQHRILSATARERVADYLVHVATAPVDPMETAIFFLSLTPDDLRVQIIARWRRLLAERLNPSDPVFAPWHELRSRMDSAGPAGENPPFSAEIRNSILARLEQRSADPSEPQVNGLVLQALRESEVDTPRGIAEVYGGLFLRIHRESQLPSGPDQPDPPPDPQRQQILELMTGPDSPPYIPVSQTHRYMSRAQIDDYGAKVQEIDRLSAQSLNAPPRAMVVRDCDPVREPRIFIRGNPSLPGREVPRQFVSVLSAGQRRPYGAGSGRLDLARSITDGSNPLTARVIVNRVWMHHFGEPLVATPSDFGRRGSPPTHPGLLDHLATQLRLNNWSLKWLHREIVLSSAWQQSSRAEAGMAALGAERDPENRLLWKAHRRRLDLESFRDTVLFHASQLEDRMGGRPVVLSADPGPQRRTVYALVDRQSLPGMYRTFDFASPDQSSERRPQTMVPQQALFALNSPFMLTQSRLLAGRSAEEGRLGQPDARIEWLYRTVLLRSPDPEEREACLEFVQEADAADPAVWDRMAQVLLASNEVMYVD